MDTISFCMKQNKNLSKKTITSLVEELLSLGFTLAQRKLVKPGYYRVPFKGSIAEFIEAGFSKEIYEQRLQLMGITGNEYDEYWYYLFYPTSIQVRGELDIIFMNAASYNEVGSNCYPLPENIDEAGLLHLKIAKILYNLLGSSYGWVNHLPNFNPTHGRPILERKLKEIYWVNFFGPEYVEKYGREFLLNAPGWKKEELSDGGLLLQLSPHISQTDQETTLQDLANYFAPVGGRYLGWPRGARISSAGKLTIL